MKAVILAATIFAAPAFAGECDAYLAQRAAGHDLATHANQISIQLIAIRYAGKMDDKTRDYIAEYQRTISDALNAYLAATKKTEAASNCR